MQSLTPGLGPELIPAIFQQYDCVIVESFGVGGIPQRLMDAFAEELGDYDQTHKILILTTQVTYEGSDGGQAGQESLPLPGGPRYDH